MEVDVTVDGCIGVARTSGERNGLFAAGGGGGVEVVPGGGRAFDRGSLDGFGELNRRVGHFADRLWILLGENRFFTNSPVANDYDLLRMEDAVGLDGQTRASVMQQLNGIQRDGLHKPVSVWWARCSGTNR